MTTDATPAALHPIGVVAERTGLSLDVLRVWERRYAVVEPTRDEAGRRMYTDADIDRLRLLAQATSGGRSIGQVAALPVDALRALVRDEEAARWAVRRPAASGGGTRAMDGAGVEAVLRRAASLLGVPAFVEEVVPAFARRIGDEWHAGRLGVAQEHLATGVVRPLLAQLRNALPVSASAPVLLVATPVGERHEIGALLVAAAASVEGWRVTYLGPDVPSEAIAQAALDTGVRAVALSSVYVDDRERVAAELADLRARLPADVAILAGGAGLAGLTSARERVDVVVLESLAELRRYLRGGSHTGEA
jgi:methylmalonyl-CoA mutase cobalamin-binding subunit